MNTKELIRHLFSTTRQVSSGYLADLADADLLLRAAPGMNHIAWQLGHLICWEHEMIAMLGHRVPDLPAGFVEAHRKEAAASDDRGKFATKATYLDLFERVRAATLAALDETPEADLGRRGPESMPSYCPSVGALFNLLALHEMMHAGQWVAVRRTLGKPISL